jgi:uncharacterized HAD superfamily protein
LCYNDIKRTGSAVFGVTEKCGKIKSMKSKIDVELNEKLAQARAWVEVGARYRHYKNQLSYVALNIVLREESLTPAVIYQAEYGEKLIWDRLVSDFVAEVEDENGNLVRRFVKIKEEKITQQNIPKKGVIAVDIDDVLAAMVPDLIKRHNRLSGDSLSVDDYEEDFMKMMKISVEELRLWRENFLGDVNSFYPALKLIDGAVEGLTELSKDYKLIALTSRPQEAEAATRKWLDKNIPGLIGEVFFSGNYDDNISEESHLRNKGEMADKLNIDWLIDDQPKHCYAVVDSGQRAILFGDCAWNRHAEMRPGITRARDWREVVRIIEGENEIETKSPHNTGKSRTANADLYSNYSKPGAKSQVKKEEK